MALLSRFRKAAAAFRQPSIQDSARVPIGDPNIREFLFGATGALMSAREAMKHPATFRCVSIIAGVASLLPFPTYLKQPDGDREPDLKDEPGTGRMLSQRPNARMSAVAFWREMVAQMLLEGNAVALILRDPKGTPKGLIPVKWGNVYVRRPATAEIDVQLIYDLALDTGQRVRVYGDDVLHVGGTPVWIDDRFMSPIEAYAQGVQTGFAANDFAQRYFKNDATPSGFISNPGSPTKDGQAQEIRDYWQKQFGGENRFKGPAVLTDGGEYKVLTIKATDAQLLESRKFAAIDIARIFGVPPHLAGELEGTTAWGTGMEQLNRQFLLYTVGPHLAAIEAEVNWKIHGWKRFSEFDRERLLEADSDGQAKFFRAALGGSAGPGWMTQNEVRKRKNLPNIPGGDSLTEWKKGVVEGKSTDGSEDPAAPGL
jgi:HK97 family phage portal protein